MNATIKKIINSRHQKSMEKAAAKNVDTANRIQGVKGRRNTKNEQVKFEESSSQHNRKQKINK